MSHALVSTSAFDVKLGSLLLANMLSAWLDAELSWPSNSGGRA